MAFKKIYGDINDCVSLDIRHFSSHLNTPSHSSGTISTTDPDDQPLHIDFELDSYQDSTGTFKLVYNDIALVIFLGSRPAYGNNRNKNKKCKKAIWFFKCPMKCGKDALIIYLKDSHGLFACKKCHGVVLSPMHSMDSTTVKKCKNPQFVIDKFNTAVTPYERMRAVVYFFYLDRYLKKCLKQKRVT